MSLDTPTLFVIAVFVCAVAGFLLLLSWLQNRTVRGSAFWASALIIGSIGVALIAARGDISDTWSQTQFGHRLRDGLGRRAQFRWPRNVGPARPRRRRDLAGRLSYPSIFHLAAGSRLR
jgi:hypothetical protein